MEKSITNTIERIESLFSKFNKEFYNGELIKPIITVYPDHRKRALGWCTSWKAWKETKKTKSDGYYEINICAEHLERPFKEVAETLLHEMVHLYNIQIGVQDTSRSGTYHNKKYKEAAEKHGLNVEKVEKYGWTKTNLNEEAKKFVESLKETKFSLVRNEPMKITGNKKSSTRKYICPSCGCIVRATKEVNIICADCKETFKEEVEN